MLVTLTFTTTLRSGLIVTVAVPDIGDPTTGGTSLAPDNVSVCVFDIPPICPIDVQAPNTVTAASAAIAAISLRLPRFALIAFLHQNRSCGPCRSRQAAGACVQYTALRGVGRQAPDLGDWIPGFRGAMASSLE
jgi:hypothetical protein